MRIIQETQFFFLYCSLHLYFFHLIFCCFCSFNFPNLEFSNIKYFSLTGFFIPFIQLLSVSLSLNLLSFFFIFSPFSFLLLLYHFSNFSLPFCPLSIILFLFSSFLSLIAFIRSLQFLSFCFSP